MWNVGENRESNRSEGKGLGVPSKAAAYWRRTGSMDDMMICIALMMGAVGVGWL